MIAMVPVAVSGMIPVVPVAVSGMSAVVPVAMSGMSARHLVADMVLALLAVPARGVFVMLMLVVAHVAQFAGVYFASSLRHVSYSIPLEGISRMIA